jgi:DNA-binding transcriptional MocR family regulator
MLYWQQRSTERHTTMSLISIDPQSNTSLVEQVVSGIQTLIDKEVLRTGNKAASIRLFATQHHISAHTVSEAYERLVALGYLESRPRTGFFIKKPNASPTVNRTASVFDQAFDHLSQVRSQLIDTKDALNVSSGRLPHDWVDTELIRTSLKALASKTDSSLGSYGEPFGYRPLRLLLQSRLGDIGIHPELEQILITAGASQATDLVIKYLLRRGDRVMVDDPGYFNLFSNLQLYGIEALPVARRPDGPDLDQIEKFAQQYRPSLMFTQSVLQTPTGTTIAPGIAHRLLRLAEQYDFRIVENDAYADMLGSPVTRLATLDQLSRVIYVGSFSKTLFSSMRVGFIGAEKGLIQNLTNLKMILSITGSLLDERLIFHSLTEGHYRRSVERLRTRLGTALQATADKLEQSGFEVFCKPLGGKFLWIRHPHHEDSETISRLAAKANIVIAPGKVFRSALQTTPWFRINVGYGEMPLLTSFLSSME